MTGTPWDMTAVLTSVDARVHRFRAGDRATVLEDAAAAETVALVWLAPSATMQGHLEIECMRIRFFECKALARLFDAYIAAHLPATVDADHPAYEEAQDGVAARPCTRAEADLPPREGNSVQAAHGPTSLVGDPQVPSLTRADRARVARPARTPRMGFVVDVIGYGRRTGRLRALAQHRVSELTNSVLEHLGVDQHSVDQQGTGDGVLAFLPVELDVPHAVPRLLVGWRDLLREDNELYTDRLRLRMAVALGPVAPGPLGFVGSPATTAGRLLDSDVLRAAAADNPSADMVVLMSDALHSFAVDPADPAFTRHRVDVKDYRDHGWLWIG